MRYRCSFFGGGMRKEGDKDDVYKLAKRLVRNFLDK